MFGFWIERHLRSRRDAGFDKQEVFTQTTEVRKRVRRPSQVVQNAVAIDDVEAVGEHRVGAVKVEIPNRAVREAPPQDGEVRLAWFRDRDCAATVDEEARMIADSRADLEHATSSYREPERREMLLTPLVVAEIVMTSKVVRGRDVSQTAVDPSDDRHVR